MTESKAYEAAIAAIRKVHSSQEPEEALSDLNALRDEIDVLIDVLIDAVEGDVRRKQQTNEE